LPTSLRKKTNCHKMKYLYIIFSIFYRYYDNDWDDPLIRTTLSMSLLIASVFNLIKGIVYYYTGLSILKFDMFFLLIVAGIIFLLIYRNRKIFLSKVKNKISKKDRIIGYIIITILLLNWTFVLIVYGNARQKFAKL